MIQQTRCEYLKEAEKNKRGQMKLTLWNWGGALDVCKRKHEEIRKLNRILEDAKKLANEVPIVKNGQEEYQAAMEKLPQEYIQELQSIQIMIEQILKEKNRVDKMIVKLNTEEQEFLHLRYEKGYGYDYISLKIHMSRAQCFRLNEKALDRLLKIEKELQP